RDSALLTEAGLFTCSGGGDGKWGFFFSTFSSFFSSKGATMDSGDAGGVIFPALTGFAALSFLGITNASFFYLLIYNNLQFVRLIYYKIKYTHSFVPKPAPS